MRSTLVKLTALLYLVKFPVAVSNATSTPAAKVLVPITPDRFSRGFQVNPIAALTPA